jgi:hypothetical protein
VHAAKTWHSVPCISWNIALPLEAIAVELERIVTSIEAHSRVPAASIFQVHGHDVWGRLLPLSIYSVLDVHEYTFHETGNDIFGKEIGIGAI